MALLNDKGNYIKLESNGDYLIYESQIDRLREKNAPSFDDVILVYNNQIDEINEEAYFTNEEKVKDELRRWAAEKNLFISDYFNKQGPKHYYCLIESLVPNATDVIPRAVEAGSICAQSTKEEVYKLAKQNKIFGETQDI